MAGDVIVGFNGSPVEKSNELSTAVARTKPGTSVPVEIFRGGRRQTIDVKVAALESEPDQQSSAGPDSNDRRFGVALNDLTPEIRRQLGVPERRSGAVVVDVLPGSAAARAGINPGDVILEVNRKAVKGASDAAAALRAIGGQDVAFVLILREGQEVFVPIPGEG
jgi:serine protease Do